MDDKWSEASRDPRPACLSSCCKSIADRYIDMLEQDWVKLFSYLDQKLSNDMLSPGEFFLKDLVGILSLSLGRILACAQPPFQSRTRTLEPQTMETSNS